MTRSKLAAYVTVAGAGWWASDLAQAHHDGWIFVVTMLSGIGGIWLMRSML